MKGIFFKRVFQIELHNLSDSLFLLNRNFTRTFPKRYKIEHFFKVILFIKLLIFYFSSQQIKNVIFLALKIMKQSILLFNYFHFLIHYFDGTILNHRKILIYYFQFSMFIIVQSLLIIKGLCALTFPQNFINNLNFRLLSKILNEALNLFHNPLFILDNFFILINDCLQIIHQSCCLKFVNQELK